MTLFGHVLTAGILMTVIALSGALTLLLSARTVERLITPLVAFAAGTLLGGALLHLQPAALLAGLAPIAVGLYTLAGFVLFLLLERIVRRHRHHRAAGGPLPLTYLILLGDGVHNFLGGLAIGAAFVTDIRLGWTAWLAAAAHEIPQELGDFGVLIHGGWPRRRALILNVLSGSSFLVGALLAYAVPTGWNIAWLIPFAAGNFIYIAAVDLIPEIARPAGRGMPYPVLGAFSLGVLVMLATALTQG
ncbi:MAG TPA: ZIP family metal transporter [Gemmatimonadales bacterium]|nr:ZIP family metal transporter [Gemmatimonadales bacterium]